MEDISGTGIEVDVIAIPTFPVGIKCTAFADDADPLDIPELQVAEWAMGLNGDLIIWRTPKAFEITLNIIPNTDEDKNLSILLDAETVSKNKMSVKNSITLVVKYPDGTIKTLTDGALLGGIPLNAVASGGRFKTRSYRFVFGKKIN